MKKSVPKSNNNDVQSPKEILVKKVSAQSIADVAEHLDNWCKSAMDMYVVDVGPSEEREGWTTFIIVMSTNRRTRETLRV